MTASNVLLSSVIDKRLMANQRIPDSLVMDWVWPSWLVRRITGMSERVFGNLCITRKPEISDMRSSAINEIRCSRLSFESPESIGATALNLNLISHSLEHVANCVDHRWITSTGRFAHSLTALFRVAIPLVFLWKDCQKLIEIVSIVFVLYSS